MSEPPPPVAPGWLRRIWRRDEDEPHYLDGEDLWTLERNKRGLVVVGLLAAVAVLVSYGSAGFAGLVVSISVLTVAVLLAVVLGVPAGPTRRRRRRPPLPSFDEPYPTFREVNEQLSWAQVSPRHYDLMTRPLLARLLASRLDAHRGIDLHRDPEAARAAVGDDLWWWFDPERPARGSSQPPGVDVATLTRLVERLERL